MPVCSTSRHPVRGLLCPLSLLLRFTLSLADLWPVQWFAGPLSGPPLPGYSYPSICVSRSPECTSLLRPGVLHWWVVLGQALYLLACLRSILALSSSRFCCSCRASWAPGLCLALVLHCLDLLLGASLLRFPDPPSALPWIPLPAPCPRFAADAHTPSPSPLPFLILFVDLYVGALVDPAGASPTRLRFP